MWRTDPSLDDRVLHLPTPDCARCPYSKVPETCGLHCASEAKKTIQEAGTERFAAMIAEPILGNGGIVVPPLGYFAQLAQFLREHGILWIDDEMQTGFGRTGRWFGIEHHGVIPDIMTVAKALGNGVPIGAFIASDRVAAAYTRPGASTFGGNGASMSAAHAVLDIMHEEKLPERADRLGAILGTGLSQLMNKHCAVGCVRGLGLMRGAEINDSDGNPDAPTTDAILEKMRERGFLIGKTGSSRNVLAFMPPLIIEESLIHSMLAALDACLDELETTR